MRIILEAKVSVERDVMCLDNDTVQSMTEELHDSVVGQVFIEQEFKLDKENY